LLLHVINALLVMVIMPRSTIKSQPAAAASWGGAKIQFSNRQLQIFDGVGTNVQTCNFTLKFVRNGWIPDAGQPKICVFRRKSFDRRNNLGETAAPYSRHTNITLTSGVSASSIFGARRFSFLVDRQIEPWVGLSFVTLVLWLNRTS